MLVEPIYSLLFNILISRCDNLGCIYDVTKQIRFKSLNLDSWQNKNEILGLLNFVADYELHTILEIGTARGGTLFLISRVADDNAKIISIDLPEGRFGGGYPGWKSKLFFKVMKKKQKLYLLREDSRSLKTLHNVEMILGNSGIDLLFIDGDHSYDGVKSDFDKYSRMVNPGGFIAFHDIVDGPENKVGGVPRFWREIKEIYVNHYEFIDNWNQREKGLGLVKI